MTVLAFLLALGSSAQVPQTPASVTAVGCVAQLPDAPTAPPTGHEQAAAKGLTITRARLEDRAVPQTAAPVEQSFWLVGAKAAELLRFVGKRVELTGTIDDRLAPNPGGRAITDAGASPSRRAATAPPDPPANPHPSAPARAISVSSFRLVNETCS
jgi:hypothetical protein